MFVCFVVRGESPDCRLFSTGSMLEWLRISSPTTHRGAVRKEGAKIPWGGRCQSVLRPMGSSISPLF